MRARHLAHGPLAVAALATLAPVAWMLGMSLKPPADIFAAPLDPLPVPPTLANFERVLANTDVPLQFFNSLVFAGGVALGQVALAVPAAWAFSRPGVRGSHALFTLFLLTLPVPFIVLYLPNYLIVAQLGWIDSFPGMIVPQLASAYGTFLLRQRFLSFPSAVVDAARVDGAGESTLLWRIVVPAERGAVLALGVFVFITTWNEYVWPSLVAPDPARAVLTTGTARFASGEAGVSWGPTMAAVVLATLPVATAYLVMRGRLIRTFTEGGVTG